MANEAMNFCGCCGDETNLEEWCRKCLPHIAKSGQMFERTFYAQHGRDCPYQLSVRPKRPESLLDQIHAARDTAIANNQHALAEWITKHADEPCPAAIEQALGMEFCAKCGEEKTARGGDVHCSGDCDDFNHDNPGGCHRFVPPTQPVEAERAKAHEALDSDIALDILDDMVRRGNGAVTFCETENGNIGLWIGDVDENTKALGTGDTVYEAITEAAANLSKGAIQ